MSDGRAERRRRARAETKIALRDTGVVQRVNIGTREMPPKIPGQHRWILVTTYAVPEALIEAVMADVEHSDVHFDHENRLDSHVGCYDCEQVLTKARARSVCPGDPADR